MKQILFWLPLFALAPTLAVGYYLGMEHGSARTTKSAGEGGEALDPNLHAARSAFEQASRLQERASQASPGKSQELLRQAIVQYRLCLAYESRGTQAGRLFDEARQNLEASRGLLDQGPRPLPEPVKEPPPVRAAPVSVQPAPLLPGEAKPEPSLEQRRLAGASRPAGQAESAVASAKPVKKPRTGEGSPGKRFSVGPDGVPFVPVEPER